MNNEESKINTPPVNASSSTQMHSVQQNTAMAILSYLGPLVIISYFFAKDDPFVKFHIKQGLVLFVIEIIIWVLRWAFFFFFPLWMLLRLATWILAIIGIVYAAKGQEKELPIVGGYGKHFKI